jgi:MEMO1 family protein
MEHIRKPTVAGMFYPSTFEKLIYEIKKCFQDIPGPGLLPVVSSDVSDVFGVIVPHAGYSFSGGIAAHAYYAIAAAGLFDAYVILGPNHHGVGSSVALSPHDMWQTPLGMTTVDPLLKEKLGGGIIDLDEFAHSYQENSVEVQLPFLQYINNDHPFSIAPIVMAMQDYETSKEVGEQLAKVLMDDNRKICIIASSDFSHEGFSYGHIPPRGLKVNEFVRAQDEIAIQKILKMDAKGLIDTIEEKNISMCGYGPVVALLTAAKVFKRGTVELLKYGTSYDLYPDSSACVGYGAFAIR